MSSDDGRVIKYDGVTGAPIGTFIQHDAINVMTNPGDLHFGPNGELLVTHGTTNTIKRFSSTVTDDFLGDYFPSGSGGIAYDQDFVFNQAFSGGPCPVPEPSTILTLFAGGAILTRRRRRIKMMS